MASDCVPLAQHIQHAPFHANSVVYLVPIMRASFAAVQKSPFKSDSTNSRSIQNPKLPLLAPKPAKNCGIMSRTRQTTSVDPSIQNRCQILKRNRLADNLKRKLQHRPGPLELVNRRILQVDAELEQAVRSIHSLNHISKASWQQEGNGMVILPFLFLFEGVPTFLNPLGSHSNTCCSGR
ncbi:RPEL repeat domain-containing protein [Ditylenchus destructor]|nr:RPEL repeat domain-containing protein [Ditylenchus destructor]